MVGWLLLPQRQNSGDLCRACKHMGLCGRANLRSMIAARPRQIAGPGGEKGPPGTTGGSTPLNSDYDIGLRRQGAHCTATSLPSPPPAFTLQLGGFGDAEGSSFPGAIIRLERRARPPWRLCSVSIAMDSVQLWSAAAAIASIGPSAGEANASLRCPLALMKTNPTGRS